MYGGLRLLYGGSLSTSTVSLGTSGLVIIGTPSKAPGTRVPAAMRLSIFAVTSSMSSRILPRSSAGISSALKFLISLCLGNGGCLSGSTSDALAGSTSVGMPMVFANTSGLLRIAASCSSVKRTCAARAARCSRFLAGSAPSRRSRMCRAKSASLSSLVCPLLTLLILRF